jgi:hypothetical protein
MGKDFLKSNALICRFQNPGNKIFSLFANGLELRDYIAIVLLSSEYFMVLTTLRMSLSFSPSKGGAAERRI